MTPPATAPAAKGASVDLAYDVMRDWSFYNNTGWVALDRGNLTRAAQCFRAAIEVLRPHETKARPLMARSNSDFARVLHMQKRDDEAEPLLRWSVSVRENDPATKPEQLATDLFILADIHRTQKRHSEAEAVLRRTLILQETSIGQRHPDMLKTVEALASTLAEEGKSSEAMLLYRRGLLLREANHERNMLAAEELERAAGVYRLGAEANIGTPSYFGGNGTSSNMTVERLLSRAKAAREAGSESPGAAAATERLAGELRKAGRTDEADEMDVKARAIRDAIETRAAGLGR